MKIKLICILGAILFTVGCGNISNNDKDKPVRWNPEVSPCSNFSDKSLACLPSAMWTIIVLQEDFPRNAVLNLDGHPILDECSGRVSAFNVMRGSVTNIIAENYLYIPKDQKLELEIIDRGSNCLGNKVYYLNKDQKFFTEEFDGQWYVDIELD